MFSDEEQYQEALLAQLRRPSIVEEVTDDLYKVCPCIDNVAKNKSVVAKITTIAGMSNNIVTKGIMKAVGFIFKAIMDHNPGIKPIVAVLFPSAMHLVFNCSSKWERLCVLK